MSHNNGLSPTACAVAAVAVSRVGPAPAAGYAGRYMAMKREEDGR